MGISIAGLVVLIFGAGRTGTTVLPLLKAGQGVRAAAVGEAFTSIAGDASSVFWNPAGLAEVDGYQLALSHHEWFTGIRDEVLHGAAKLGAGGAGLGLVYSGEAGIESWSELNEPGDTFGTWDGVLSAGYGLKFAGKHRLGAAVKLVTEDLHIAQGWGAGLDIGFQSRVLEFQQEEVSIGRLDAGLALRHLGGMWFESGMEWLPVELAAGCSYTLRRLLAALDIVLPVDNSPNLRLGLEYLPAENVALRLGYRTGPQSLAQLGALGGLCAGLGFVTGSLGVDYSFSPYGELGMVHRLGLWFGGVPARPATTGSLHIRVLDATAREPLEAVISLSGTADTSVSTSELHLDGILPGTVIARAVRADYEPVTDTFRILAGRRTTALLLMSRLRRGEISGRVYDAGTREPVSARIVYRGPAFGEEPVPASGEYRLRDLPPGEYRLGISGPSEEYLPQSCTLRVSGGEKLQRDFHLARRRQTIVLEGINFETGRADILPQFEPVLNRAGEILRNTPQIRVELAGHTDPREINTREFPSNWELSQARAEAVRRYLIERFQIAPERLTARGYADTQPIAPNDSPEGMARNRRTEFRVLEQE